jgi:hypothetical protein
MSRTDSILSTLVDRVERHIQLTSHHNPAVSRHGVERAAMMAAIAAELDTVHSRIDELDRETRARRADE